MQRLTTQDWPWACMAYLADSGRGAIWDALSCATDVAVHVSRTVDWKVGAR